jgi:WD40 repeat protein
VLWDVASGELIRKMEEHEDYVAAVAFSPDGTMAASASEDNTAILWDVSTGSVLRRLVGHTNWLRDVAFSPDGTLLLTGARDARLILWDVASGLAINEFNSFGIDVSAVSYAPDGLWIASTAEWNVVIWYLDTLEDTIEWVHGNRVIRDLTCIERQQYGLPCD